MSPHAQHVRESPVSVTSVAQPQAPAPPPKDYTTRPPDQSSTVTHKSPSLIKRKPLPPTAFSPLSTISSPDSIFSSYAQTDRQVDVPSSAVALNEILESSPERPHLGQPFRSEDTPVTPFEDLLSDQQNSLRRQSTTGDVSIRDFPAPPQTVNGKSSQSNGVIGASIKQTEDMGARVQERPPPLRMESVKAVKTLDAKKPQSPAGVFTSFFSRKQNVSPQNISPSGESSTTEISESRSAGPSPYPGSIDDTSSYFAQAPPQITGRTRYASPQQSMESIQYDITGRLGPKSPSTVDILARCSMLETELKEISKELAGSIRRELDLEDMVDRLQIEVPSATMSADRTSDYFSDSGTSSVRHGDSGLSTKDEIDKVKRESEQARAQMRIELSQKWQDEVAQRRLLESHVSILEGKLSQTRRDTNESSDSSARIRELETALDDARRRLQEERQTKENFEDLLTALKVDLEQHRNDRDNLRDEVVPKLRLQIEGLESSMADTQKQTYDFAKMQQELQSLRDENIAISSARKMEQEMIRSGMGQATDDDDLSSVRSSLILPKTGGLNRSNTVAGRTTTRGSLAGSSSLSRANSIINRPLPDTPESITDKLNAVEQQRDALHTTAKHLRKRLDHQNKKHEREIAKLQTQLNKLNETAEVSRRGGYENEVRALRQEINLLRKRADDALDQKWQCEKGLSGLKMDLDRSKQETASLQKLLQARDKDDPELLSGALEQAIEDLQSARANSQESLGSLEQEQQLAHQLAESATRSEALAAQVRQQLEANSSLRTRLMSAVENGEKNQHASAIQISQLQSKLKRLEDTITSAQIQSETAVMKHEEDLRNLKQSHNNQLQRAKMGIKSPNLSSPSDHRSPLSPMFANSKRSPRLDQTSSGPGQTLNQALKTEFLENKVAELEKALTEAENGMEEVVGRMNQAQIGVFELQQERDEALKRTKKLEADVHAERLRFEMLVTGGLGAGEEYTTL